MMDIRIAMVVCNCPVGLIEDNLAAMAGWVLRAVEKRAAIICFPELNITGYSSRPEILQFAQTIPGPVTDRVAAMATETGLTILAGLVEKDSSGCFFASHIVAKPDGSVGVYRKLHIAPPEQPLFTPGKQIPLFESAGIKFGIQLCYDAHFPELSTHMAENGAELIFLPHASPRGDATTKHQSWMRHLPARAYDNSLFVAAVNQTGPNGLGLEFPGNGVILGPSGDLYAEGLNGEEGLVLADLSSEKLNYVRGHAMRYFFPNRRPELYDR
jgi:predicted amidohydrolase